MILQCLRRRWDVSTRSSPKNVTAPQKWNPDYAPEPVTNIFTYLKPKSHHLKIFKSLQQTVQSPREGEEGPWKTLCPRVPPLRFPIFRVFLRTRKGSNLCFLRVTRLPHLTKHVHTFDHWCVPEAGHRSYSYPFITLAAAAGVNIRLDKVWPKNAEVIK